MRYLKTSEAATLLNVTANTLRAWESRFDFPTPQRSPGNHRSYLHCEVAALRRALRDGLSVSSAVVRAQEALAADGRSLITALEQYDRERADAAIEAALGFRSVEQSVEEVLLPALEQIRSERTLDSAAWAFAAHWGGEWLRRATRLAPPGLRRLSILVGDASRDELDPDALYIRALELFCLRAGIDVMSLSVRGVAGIGDVITVHGPDLVVLAGAHMSDDRAASWTHSVRREVGPMPIALYRRGDHFARMPTRGTDVLPSRASEAQRRLVALLDHEQTAAAIPGHGRTGSNAWRRDAREIG